MAKVYKYDLPIIFNNYFFNFCSLPAIHSYSTRSASSNKFFVQRTRCAKTSQFLNVCGIKIWNEYLKVSRTKQPMSAKTVYQSLDKSKKCRKQLDISQEQNFQNK